MPTNKITVTGAEINLSTNRSVSPLLLGGLEVSTKKAIALDSGRGVDSKQHNLEHGDEDVVRLVFEDDIEVYTSVETLRHGLLSNSSSRGIEGEDFVIPEKLLFSADGERGLIEIAIKAVSFLNIKGKVVDAVVDKVGECAARVLAEKIEDQIIGEGGLYSISDIQELEQSELRSSQSDQSSIATEQKYTPVSPSEIPLNQPVLIFLHGTASTSAGSFKGLWEDGGAEWNQIKAKFGSHIYGFEHRTLSYSPIKNALDLVNSLPDKAKIHLVSHSRGGLVGELLCRGQMGGDGGPFSEDDFHYFDDRNEDGSVNQYLKEIFSIKNGAQKEDYEQHRRDLKLLAEGLKKKKIQVEQFVRVACPARGTTLASGKLDFYLSTLLNLAKLIPGLAGNVVFGIIQSLVLVVAKERTDASAFPGLEAQMPGSPLISMLNDETRYSKAPLAVITGDIEPKRIWKKLALLMVDRFYETDHDLVVNTPSMDGGSARDTHIAVMNERGADVNHFTYFRRKESQKGIASALTGKETPPDGFHHRSQRSFYVSRSASPEGQTPETPVVFVLPGISGSHLKIETDRIWLDPRNLAWGGLDKLKIDTEEHVEAEGLMGRSYADLIDHLSKTYLVKAFPYDWRQSILEASKELAVQIERQLQQSTGPVHIIGHSMGGLVARGMIATCPEIWRKLQQRKGSKVLMLGTPNEGSFSIIRLLAGEDKLIKALAVLDLKNNRWDLINDIFRHYPGILELLPAADTRNFFKGDIWNSIKPPLHKKWRKPTNSALGSAGNTWEVLKKVTLDPERIFYVAGCANKTPVDLEITKNKIIFKATNQGDGRVPWEGGIPAGIQCWYADSEHGDLANYSPAFMAYQDILDNGETHRLPIERPVSREAYHLTDLSEDLVDVRPSFEQLNSFAIGGSYGAPVSRLPKAPKVKVSVTHGDLCYSRHPVMVGHYQSDIIVHAEAYMDERLNGRLSECHQLGMYPGPLGTNEIILSDNVSSTFPGAVIVGLGELGELTAGSLCDTLTKAFIRFALTMRGVRDDSDGVTISSLLIGSGEGGIDMENSIAATLRAVSRANERMMRAGSDFTAFITSLEFIELYQDVAIAAQQILSNPRLDSAAKKNMSIIRKIGNGGGGRKRVSFYNSRPWWDRIRIKSQDGNLSFLAMTRHAGVPSVTHSGKRKVVKKFLDEVTNSTDANPQNGKVLYELLIPYAFKQQARNSRDLVLVLDERSAEYPWEILEFSDDESNEPLALRVGFIRQLLVESERRNLCFNRKALILGDPDYQGSKVFQQLQGAQQEAIKVEKLLQNRLHCTGLSNRPKSSAILRHLMAGEYQILHMAAHGVFEYLPEGAPEDTMPITGMVIGPDEFLTPELVDSLPFTPEFVFLNCCHLGNTSDPDSQERPLQQPYRIAANLATQFIRQGSKAVIAAGWAVDDSAAHTFAEVFYQSMLDGQPFGKAVKAARVATRDLHQTKNTWAAYQCYGDPGYCFDTRNKANEDAVKEWNFTSVDEAINEVDNLSQSVKTANASGQFTIKQDLDGICLSQPDEWHSCGLWQASLGRCWGELLDFERAIEAYQLSLSAPDGRAPISAIEQLANLQVRFAVLKCRQAITDGETPTNKKKLISELKALLKDSNDKLATLCLLHGSTTERRALQGGSAKRSAQTYALLGEKTKLKQSLEEMAKSYDEAYLLIAGTTKVNQLYPLVQYLTASWLRHQLFKLVLPKDFQSRLAVARKVNFEDIYSDDKFWTSVAETDMQFFDALSDGTVLNRVPEFTENYLKIRKTASSPREFGSVCEHFSFLHDVLSTGGNSKLIEAIETLNTNLASQ